MTEIFGTTELLTTFTNFAPARMMPLCSDSVPTIKPVVFCRKISGVALCQQS